MYCSCGCNQYDHNPDDFFYCSICDREGLHEVHRDDCRLCNEIMCSDCLDEHGCSPAKQNQDE